MRKFWMAIAVTVSLLSGTAIGQFTNSFTTEVELSPTASLGAMNGHAYMSLKESEKKLLIMAYVNGCAGAYRQIHKQVWNGATGMFLQSVEDRKRTYEKKVEEVRKYNRHLASRAPFSGGYEALEHGGSVMDGDTQRFMAAEPEPELFLPDQFAGCERIVELMSFALEQGYDASFPMLSANDTYSRLNNYYSDVAQRNTSIIEAMSYIAAR